MKRIGSIIKDHRIICTAAAAAVIALMALTAFFSGKAAKTSAETQKAQNISWKVKLTSEEGHDMSDALDTDIYSKVSFGKKSDRLTATLTGTELKLNGVYAIWDTAPGEWSLEEGEKTVSCGQYGFIHEYVPLPSPANELIINVPANAVLCDLIFYTEGELPSSVQRWEPPYEKADLLLFPTHGDDEHLFFGGIMPYYGGEMGYKVQVAYMTNHVFTEKYRCHEQLDGLWKVGIKAYPVYGDFVDEYSKTLREAQDMYGTENVERWQVEMIRRFKPYVVVGHDFEGEYGHGAHRINGTTLQISVPDAADPSKFTDSYDKYGTWDTPKFYSHLYNRDNGVIIEWGDMPLKAFGGKTALEMAAEGYKCHESQQYTRFRVMTDGYGDCRQFGLYRSTVGEDVNKNDLLEHIVFEPDPTPTPEPTPEPTEVPTPEPTEIPAVETNAAPTDAPGSDLPADHTAQPATAGENDATPFASPAVTAPSGNSEVRSGGDKSIGWIIAALVLAVALLAVMLFVMSKKKSR